jgi:diphthamide synthase subunit DPH2
MISKIISQYDYIVILVSKVNHQLFKLLKDQVKMFAQLSCRRLSIDWGYKPLLASYEHFAPTGMIKWNQTYSIDYYSINGD